MCKTNNGQVELCEVELCEVELWRLSCVRLNVRATVVEGRAVRAR